MRSILFLPGSGVGYFADPAIYDCLETRRKAISAKTWLEFRTLLPDDEFGELDIWYCNGGDRVYEQDRCYYFIEASEVETFINTYGEAAVAHANSILDLDKTYRDQAAAPGKFGRPGSYDYSPEEIEILQMLKEAMPSGSGALRYSDFVCYTNSINPVANIDLHLPSCDDEFPKEFVSEFLILESDSLYPTDKLEEMKEELERVGIQVIDAGKFSVSFFQNRGSLYMQVMNWHQSVSIWFSPDYDPIPRLLTWMEAILTGVDECAFEIYSENEEWRMESEANSLDMIWLTITEVTDGVVLEGNVSKEELVFSIYHGLKSFGQSKEYDPNHWEKTTWKVLLLSDTNNEVGGLIGELCQLDKQALEDRLFSARPRFSYRWPEPKHEQVIRDGDLLYKFYASGSMDWEPADMQGMIKAPVMWEVDGDFDSWDINRRSQYLEDYLRKTTNEQDGTSLKRIFSPAIESFLKGSSQALRS